MEENTDNLNDIPGMPSDDEIRDRILATAGPEHWNPYGSEPRDPAALKDLSPEAAKRVLEARLVVGPGPNGNKYQHAIHDQKRLADSLSAEFARLEAQLNEVASYDSSTGKAISAIQSPERRRAMAIRQSQITGELRRIRSESGSIKLERAMADAVKAEKMLFRRKHIQAEAKRLAAQSALNAEIEEMAKGYSKARGSQ